MGRDMTEILCGYWCGQECTLKTIGLPIVFLQYKLPFVDAPLGTEYAPEFWGGILVADTREHLRYLVSRVM
jgi:hypothetical protein